MFRFFVWSLVLLASKCFGQSFYNEINNDNNVYLHYENDLFARTDRYYTQGFQIGSNRFIRTECYRKLNYHLELGQSVYTPSTIKSDTIIDSDRPYAATLSAKLERIYVVSNGFSWCLGGELGIIGPNAGGKQMQTGIHKATNNFLPLGWEHQINDGLIADFFCKFEKRLIHVDSSFQLVTGVSGRVGTFRTNGNLTLKMIFGNQKTSWIHGYLQNRLSTIFYDGSLQGTLISSKSEFTLTSNQINHFVYQGEIGLMFQFRRVGLAVNYCFQTKTFMNQFSNFHAWGGVQVTYKY